jgi:hypothetical protein
LPYCSNQWCVPAMKPPSAMDLMSGRDRTRQPRQTPPHLLTVVLGFGVAGATAKSQIYYLIKSYCEGGIGCYYPASKLRRNSALLESWRRRQGGLGPSVVREQ